MKTNVSIIMPCYNEVKCIKKIIPEILESISSIYNLKIIIVNDLGMEDSILEKACSLFEQCIIINTPYNMGCQEAILYGIKYEVENIKSDLLLTMDSDGQDDVNSLKTLLENVEENVIIVAQRTGNRPEGLTFSILYYLYKKLFHFLTGIVPDFGNFAAYDKTVASRIVNSPDFSIAYSLALPLITKIKRIPIVRLKRIDGKSKVGYKGLFIHALRSMHPYLINISLKLAKIALVPVSIGLTLTLISSGLRIFAHKYAFPNWATTIVLSTTIIFFQILNICLVLFLTAILSKQISAITQKVTL